MAAAAGIEHRLEATGSEDRAGPTLDDVLEVAGAAGADGEAARQRAGVAAVGHHQDMLGLHRLQHVRDVGIRDPVRLVVGDGVDGQPVAALGPVIVPAVAGIVDEQIVLRRQLAAQRVQGADDLLLAGVGQQRDAEAVVLLERRRHRLGVFDGRVELRQLLVVVVADDDGVVVAIVERRQFWRNRRGGRRLGLRWACVCV